MLMDRDDPEKRIAELERQLADATAAAGQDRAGEPPPQFSKTQPIPIVGLGVVAETRAQHAQPRPSIPRPLTPEMRERRNARWRAQGRAMLGPILYEHRRQQRRNRFVGWILGVLSVALGLWTTAVLLTGAVFPSAALWTSGIVCRSSYHLEYSFGITRRGTGRSTHFHCVSDYDMYIADSLVFVVIGVFYALVLGAVAAVGFLIWWRLRKRG